MLNAVEEEVRFLLFVSGMPRSVVALDVETTGLSEYDRIVSFGAVRLQIADIGRDTIETGILHFACNPGRPSHPRAAAVHGLSDSFLAQQRPFSEQAPSVAALLAGADVLIAHNADFDIRFLRREMATSGVDFPMPEVNCTMRSSRLSLDRACAAIGLSRSGSFHGALEDAWLALMLYLSARGAPAKVLINFGTVVRQAKAAGVDIELGRAV